MKCLINKNTLDPLNIPANVIIRGTEVDANTGRGWNFTRGILRASLSEGVKNELVMHSRCKVSQ